MKDQKGFALIQVIIAASIFSFLALATINLIDEQRKSTSFLEDQLEKIQLTRNIETILTNGISCQMSLGGVHLHDSDKLPLAELKDNSGSVIYKSNSNTGRLKFGQFTIKNSTVAGPSSVGFINVTIPILRMNSNGGPREFKPLQLKVNVSIDAHRKITSCSSMEFVFQKNGYAVLEGGLHLQWMEGPDFKNLETSTPISISFPKPFPNKVLNISVTPILPSGSNIHQNGWFQVIDYNNHRVRILLQNSDVIPNKEIRPMIRIVGH